MKTTETEATPLVDIQASKDERNIAIDKVGVRNVKYPIVVLDRARESYAAGTGSGRGALTTGDGRGQLKHVDVSARWLPDEQHFVVTHHDVTEREELQEALRRQAFHDALTGLTNRVVFREQLGRALESARGTLVVTPESVVPLPLAVVEPAQWQRLRHAVSQPGRAALVVCNPPWLPARPSAPIEHAVYDEGSRMLLGFLAGLAEHLVPGGEGWLILSDLAEHLGLRTRAQLLEAVWLTPGWLGQATVTEHVHRLRTKLGRHSEVPMIRTVRGVGYQFDAAQR